MLKKMKKVLDILSGIWYSNKAVPRGRRKTEKFEKNGFECLKNKSKKVLDKRFWF